MILSFVEINIAIEKYCTLNSIEFGVLERNIKSYELSAKIVSDAWGDVKVGLKALFVEAYKFGIQFPVEYNTQCRQRPFNPFILPDMLRTLFSYLMDGIYSSDAFMVAIMDKFYREMQHCPNLKNEIIYLLNPALKKVIIL